MIQSQKFRRTSGFTLIELLVVVLILAILMVIALPLYLNSRTNAERRTCRTNMQTIATAVQAARISNRYSSYSSFVGAVDSAKETDLKGLPVCPTAGPGSYTVVSADGGVTYGIHCSEPTHDVPSDFTPGISSE